MRQSPKGKQNLLTFGQGGQGVAGDTLRYGDQVIVTGSPGRNPEDHRMRMRSIERPKDGWKWTGTFQ